MNLFPLSRLIKMVLVHHAYEELNQQQADLLRKNGINNMDRFMYSRNVKNNFPD